MNLMILSTVIGVITIGNLLWLFLVILIIGALFNYFRYTFGPTPGPPPPWAYWSSGGIGFIVFLLIVLWLLGVIV